MEPCPARPDHPKSEPVAFCGASREEDLVTLRGPLAEILVVQVYPGRRDRCHPGPVESDRVEPELIVLIGAEEDQPLPVRGEITRPATGRTELDQRQAAAVRGADRVDAVPT